MTQEVLSLSTIVERIAINVESKKHPKGHLYELLNLADIGPYEYAIILNRSAEINNLKRLKRLTAKQKRLVEKMLDDTVKLVCPSIEPMVLAALTEQQKEMILVTWSGHISSQGAAEGNAPRRRTTGGSSRASKSSTAATQKRGSTSRRGS